MWSDYMQYLPPRDAASRTSVGTSSSEPQGTGQSSRTGGCRFESIPTQIPQELGARSAGSESGPQGSTDAAAAASTASQPAQSSTLDCLDRFFELYDASTASQPAQSSTLDASGEDERDAYQEYLDARDSFTGPSDQADDKTAPAETADRV